MYIVKCIQIEIKDELKRKIYSHFPFIKRESKVMLHYSLNSL